jgi:hypothetical protein
LGFVLIRSAAGKQIDLEIANLCACVTTNRNNQETQP